MHPCRQAFHSFLLFLHAHVPFLLVRGSWARRAFVLQAPSGSFRLLQARSYSTYHAHVRRARTRTERESAYEKTVLQLYVLTAPGRQYIKVYQCRQSVSSQPAVIRPSRALFLSCSLVYHSKYHTTGGALPRRAAKGPALAKGERPLHCRGGLVGIRVRVRHAPRPPPFGLAASPDLPHCNLS